jgi:tRNA(Ile2) C34 agmatinyltransferase TiaS
VSTVLEFGCVDNNSKKELLESIRAALLKYSVSNETGMVVLHQFNADNIYPYSKKCRTSELSKEYAIKYAKENGVEIWINGNGIIGALASLAWFSRPDDSIIMDAEINDLQ